MRPLLLVLIQFASGILMNKLLLFYSESSNSNWLTYRVASVGLLGCLTACFFFPGNMALDFATVTLLMHHNHL